MNKPLIAILLTSLSSLAYSQDITWLENGIKVNATMLPSTKSSINQTQATLNNGETVTLQSGLYVKTTQPETLNTWVSKQGLTLSPHSIIKNAYIINVSTEHGFELLKSLSTLEGVTTAAPQIKHNWVLR